jgi:hypothetical protein
MKITIPDGVVNEKHNDVEMRDTYHPQTTTHHMDHVMSSEVDQPHYAFDQPDINGPPVFA